MPVPFVQTQEVVPIGDQLLFFRRRAASAFCFPYQGQQRRNRIAPRGRFPVFEKVEKEKSKTAILGVFAF